MELLAGSLDVVAHELTHGVTDYSSDLIYANESGALNEAFSDIMGTRRSSSTSSRVRRGRADYIIGNDVITPGGIRRSRIRGPWRSRQLPRSLHRPEDNGGCTSIPSICQPRLLSGDRRRHQPDVRPQRQGVGAANREQWRRVFYRAFTQLLSRTPVSQPPAPRRCRRPRTSTLETVPSPTR
jgi:hypothetical protein